jgi:uncharacterized protein (DUF362 family)
MDNSIKVALVRTDRRRGGVAEALALIADELRLCLQNDPHPVVIPNLDNIRRPWTCTHRDTLSAAADAILAAGASSIRVVGEPGSRGHKSRDPVDRLGHRRELWNRPASFLELESDAGDEAWNTISWVDGHGQARALRVPAWIAASRCRVCLGVAKIHDVYRVGLGLANLEGIVHHEDRALLGNNHATGGSLLPGAGLAADVLESWRGSLLRSWLNLRTIAGGMRVTAPERRRLEAVERATEGLISLAARLMPAVSLIDGFVAMEGEGPRHGRRALLRTIIAGTDSIAVDAVAAALLGFEPLEIAYLRLAQASGLGTADLGSITIVGDPLKPSRSFRRHSTDRLLRLSSSTQPRVMTPRPHFDFAQARPSTRTEA